MDLIGDYSYFITMKKNKTKIVVLMIIFSMIIFLAIQVMLIKNSYESEKKDFESTARILVSKAFFQLSIDYPQLSSITDRMLMLDSSALIEKSDYIREGLTSAVIDYKNFGIILNRVFKENNFNAEYDYAVAVGKYIIYDKKNRKQEIIPNFELNGKSVIFGTLTNTKQIMPFNVFYYKGYNYFIEINSFLEFKNRTLFLFGRIKTILLISFITTFIIFGAFIYTLVIIIKQKKLSEMKSDFINNITHEFNTPLNTIKVAGANLKDRNTKTDPEKVEHLTNIILRQNTRLQRLIEDVMNASVLEEEKLVLNYSGINLFELIMTISEDIKTSYSDKEVDIIINCKDGISVRGDELQITTVFYNVLENAVKYSHGKSSVVINIFESDRYIVVTVEDNGPGIEGKEIKNIFDKFYRAHSSGIKPVKGLGLGLYFVKKIVEAHAGKIEVQSSTGKGTVFKILWPK
jgi:signal transduction histidine kinase